MASGEGELVEIVQEGNGVAGRIRCPAGLVPAPGQYGMALAEQDPAAALATIVFATATVPNGFITAPGLPSNWMPGTRLVLRGPFGRGFHLPVTARRVALAGLDESPYRLLPVANEALRQGAAVALYCAAPQPAWPVDVEMLPLSALPESLAWADFLGVDIPLQALGLLRHSLGLADHQHISCPGQALISSPLPCAGMGECGVCAVRTHRGWKLACKDGPVFDLLDLEW
jgi:dihydroorotate dehydrogenase electron transfer subunit